MSVKTIKKAKPSAKPRRGPASGGGEATRRVPAQERSRQRVERILEAAGQVFGEMGYDAATMEAIAERAETSIGSIYQFFPNKLAVFHALAARYRERTRAVVDRFLKGPAVEGRPWRELLDNAIDTFAAFHADEPGFRAVWLRLHLTPEAQSEGEAFSRDLSGELARGLEEPLAANLPGLPRAMLPLVATMVVEVMTAMLVFALRQPSQAQAAIAETKRMLHRYLEPWETRAKVGNG